jgi:hypothetical protein
MLLIAGGVIALIAVVITIRNAGARRERPRLGYMSEQWLDEHRAVHSS